MIIIEKNSEAPIELSQINHGEVFRFQGSYFIKTPYAIMSEKDPYKNTVQCVSLEDGFISKLHLTTKVYKVSCKLIIE